MTVQRKTLAKGSILEIAEFTGSPTYAEYGRIETLTLPSLDYEAIEVPELNPQDDAGNALDAEPMEFGDQMLGEFEFTHYWDPKHADAELLDGWWEDKQDLLFRVTTPHASTAARITWRGKIKTLAPAQLAKKDYMKRTVTGIVIVAPAVTAVV